MIDVPPEDATGAARLPRSQAGHWLPTWLERLSIRVDSIDYHLSLHHRSMHVRRASLAVRELPTWYLLLSSMPVNQSSEPSEELLTPVRLYQPLLPSRPM